MRWVKSARQALEAQGKVAVSSDARNVEILVQTWRRLCVSLTLSIGVRF